MYTKSLLSLLALSGTSAAQGVLGRPVSQTVYNNIIEYSGFAAASYADSCDTPQSGATVLQYFNDAASDTQATLFQYDAAKQIVIAFRGTSTPKDFNTDLTFGLVALTAAGTKCSSCKVHSGFQSSWAAISSGVLSAIRSALSANPGYTLIVTGHSLGGGIAGIAAPSIAASGIKIQQVYTYGEPRNGNSDYATYVNQVVPSANYFRVTHANDGVPQIPPQILGYVHHSTEYWQKPQASITAANTYVCPALIGAENSNCNNGQSAGNNPINGAHISYSNGVIGNSLYIAACGGTSHAIP